MSETKGEPMIRNILTDVAYSSCALFVAVAYRAFLCLVALENFWQDISDRDYILFASLGVGLAFTLGLAIGWML